MLSQASEEGEKLVVGPIPTRLSVERCDRVEKPLLQLKTGIHIDLRGLNQLMTQPIAQSRTARHPVATDPSLTCSLRAEVPGKGDYYVRCVQHQRAEDQLN